VTVSRHPLKELFILSTAHCGLQYHSSCCVGATLARNTPYTQSNSHPSSSLPHPIQRSSSSLGHTPQRWSHSSADVILRSLCCLYMCPEGHKFGSRHFGRISHPSSHSSPCDDALRSGSAYYSPILPRPSLAFSAFRVSHPSLLFTNI
jgi:hypothetical protein